MRLRSPAQRLKEQEEMAAQIEQILVMENEKMRILASLGSQEPSPGRPGRPVRQTPGDSRRERPRRRPHSPKCRPTDPTTGETWSAHGAPPGNVSRRDSRHEPSTADASERWTTPGIDSLFAWCTIPTLEVLAVSVTRTRLGKKKSWQGERPIGQAD